MDATGKRLHDGAHARRNRRDCRQDGGAAVPGLDATTCGHSDVPVSNLSVASPTLDDVFLQHTGRMIRDEETGGDETNNAFRPWLGLSDGR